MSTRMTIKERNALHDRVIRWLDTFYSTRCGMARGCYGGHCYCNVGDMKDGYWLDGDDVEQLLELVLGEREC